MFKGLPKPFRRFGSYGPLAILAMALAIPATSLVYLISNQSPKPATGEVINYFGVGIRIHDDLSATITEDVIITSEQKVFKYGIARLLPSVRYEKRKPQKISYELDAPFVTIDGIQAPLETLKIDDTPETFGIFFNAEAALLPAGRHHYTLQYKANNLFRNIEGRQVLEWNATGSYWRAFVNQAKVVVNLPRSIKPEEVQYLGRTEKWIMDGTKPIRSRVSPVQSAWNPQGELEFASKQPLEEQEGLIVHLNWPAPKSEG